MFPGLPTSIELVNEEDIASVNVATETDSKVFVVSFKETENEESW